jgi:hypothetical protein
MMLCAIVDWMMFNRVLARVKEIFVVGTIE